MSLRRANPVLSLRHRETYIAAGKRRFTDRFPDGSGNRTTTHSAPRGWTRRGFVGWIGGRQLAVEGATVVAEVAGLQGGVAVQVQAFRETCEFCRWHTVSCL